MSALKYLLKIKTCFSRKLTIFFARKREQKIIGLSLLFVLLLAYYFCLPRNLFPVSYSTVVVDRNGELLGARVAQDNQWRFPASDTIPEKFKICLIQFEDRYFYYHWGVNPIAIFRAMKQNIKAHKIVSGGSSITMQTIRLSRNADRTWFEKIKEMVLATRLEFRYSKEKILSLYASHAPFGGNVVGVEAAAWRYFGHSAQDLSWAEAATLAVLPNAPAMVHPSKNREALLNKRNRLLKRLLNQNYIDQTTYELALQEPLPVEPQPLPQSAPHLVSYFYLTENGKYCHSTIERELQTQIENVLGRWNDEFSQSDIRNMAAIVIDVEKNEVLAYCGNVNSGKNNSADQVDIIRSARSTGSILKPLLYCAMQQDGDLLPDMLLPDIPININGFAPKNFNQQFDGAVPASQALARSLNVPTVVALRNYGVPKFHDFLKKAGFTSLNKSSSHYGLSLILGGAEACLWDVAGSYNAMAKTLNYYLQNGKYNSSTLLKPKIEVNEKLQEAQQEKLFDAGAVWLTFEALKEVNRPEEIDWRNIPSMQTIAWKTGTSYGFRDAWAVGATAKYVVGVWVGNATGEGKPGLTGARTAGPIMFDIFNILPRTKWFSKPFGTPSHSKWIAKPYNALTEAEVCPQSGYLRGRFCPESKKIWICPAGQKTQACPYHVSVSVTEDEQYQVYESCAGADGMKQKSYFVLPPACEWYYKQRHPDYKSLPPFKPGCGQSGGSPMQFIYPEPNAIISLPKQLDGSKGTVVFNLAHSNNATVFWHLDGDYVGETNYFHQLAVSPAKGKHTMTVVDKEGNSLSISFTVVE